MWRQKTLLLNVVWFKFQRVNNDKTPDKLPSRSEAKSERKISEMERQERLEDLKSQHKSWSNELERWLKTKNEAYAELRSDSKIEHLKKIEETIGRFQEKITMVEERIASLFI